MRRRSTRRASGGDCSNTPTTPGRGCGRGARCPRCSGGGITSRSASGARRRRKRRRGCGARICGTATSPGTAGRGSLRVGGGAMNLMQTLDQEEVKRLLANRPVPDFRPGDTVRVSLKVVEGERERIQAFEGVCIARKNAGVNSNFTLRKISYGEGVERIFPLHSPRITAIEVVRRGVVRRAKLYYLRGRTGKRARIAERAREGVRTEAKPARAAAAPARTADRDK